MRERDDTRSGGTRIGAPLAAPEPTGAAESEGWAWMVDGGPAFSLEEATLEEGTF